MYINLGTPTDSLQKVDNPKLEDSLKNYGISKMFVLKIQLMNSKLNNAWYEGPKDATNGG